MLTHYQFVLHAPQDPTNGDLAPSILTLAPVQRWASQKMQNSNANAIAIAIEETLDAKVNPIIKKQPINPMYIHRNEDDATKARHCQTQNHPLNSSHHSTPQPWAFI